MICYVKNYNNYLVWKKICILSSKFGYFPVFSYRALFRKETNTVQYWPRPSSHLNINVQWLHFFVTYNALMLNLP